MIKENINRIQQELQEISSDAALIAVSKTKPVPMLQEAYEAGMRDFGENKVQELVDKYEQLPKDIRWHMIGHLQRNKVKYMVDKVFLIHSVDSYRLAETISKEASKKQVDVNILIEVNIASEDSKFGLTNKEDIITLLNAISVLPNVFVKGLMTVAPFVERAEENRFYFKKLRELAVDIKAENIDNISMDILSMGMTGDYLVAAQEGASYIRVGTGIFGERNYSTVEGE